jgi:uncharacterized RDD family membrane protein YckC
LLSVIGHSSSLREGSPPLAFRFGIAADRLRERIPLGDHGPGDARAALDNGPGAPARRIETRGEEQSERAMEYGRDPDFNPYRAPDHFEGPLSEGGPEKRYVQFAGFWIRFCAWLIDQLIVGAVLMIVWAVLMLVFFVGVVVPVAINGGQMPNPEDDTVPILFVLANLAFNSLGLVTPVVYYTLLEGSSWQASLGKRVVGIKVVNEHGYRISYGRALGRNLGKILSTMICLIGFLIAAFDDRKRSLHDMMAHTLVVRS